ncbi:hypothetical protein E2562_033217 [Oryza meyeriana var. granulata]|uniref:rRNA N-glycosylase n=1 Tax=Oryza meyeriana var. granulata TaxID=110450 RepID=A0A6G1BPN0_9ORYZ|nr:hypothetical protein E2562_033217 [Oryza meyeriana var. granulata]
MTICFANRTGYWHIVKGGFSGLPGPLTTLRIGASYRDLVGGHRNLDQVDLGKQFAIEAARTLASYNTATTTDAQLKQAFSRFTMMISEAMRFSVIRNTFMERWEQKSNIKKDQTKYVVHWGQLSKALVTWKRSHYNQWPPANSEFGSVLSKINVKSPTDALDLLDVLLRPIDE